MASCATPRPPASPVDRAHRACSCTRCRMAARGDQHIREKTPAGPARAISRFKRLPGSVDRLQQCFGFLPVLAPILCSIGVSGTKCPDDPIPKRVSVLRERPVAFARLPLSFLLYRGWLRGCAWSGVSRHVPVPGLAAALPEFADTGFLPRNTFQRSPDCWPEHVRSVRCQDVPGRADGF